MKDPEIPSKPIVRFLKPRNAQREGYKMSNRLEFYIWEEDPGYGLEERLEQAREKQGLEDFST